MHASPIVMLYQHDFLSIYLLCMQSAYNYNNNDDGGVDNDIIMIWRSWKRWLINSGDDNVDNEFLSTCLLFAVYHQMFTCHHQESNRHVLRIPWMERSLLVRLVADIQLHYHTSGKEKILK